MRHMPRQWPRVETLRKGYENPKVTFHVSADDPSGLSSNCSCSVPICMTPGRPAAIYNILTPLRERRGRASGGFLPRWTGLR
ncbi:hypothetical protein Ssi02_68040 [Sinosporangium siamense]|uniref:Uncharacterized protein n=1 Tax=Sinosporangium siamense TaxID=1367973 RepID=A0A919VAM6_9ACTN|nr:hypothetical protein Ssi02_68040 [Sinosporangium siamense]